MYDLTGKTALVTGASRGIGKAIALRLATEGVCVAVHYASDADAANAVVTAITEKGGQAAAVRADFEQPDAVEILYDGVDRLLAGRRLDILVNNAGILESSPFGEIGADSFDRNLAVNVRAPFFVVQQAVPRMSEGGRIVMLSSAVTRIASPFVHYAMAKGALEVLGHTLANALGPRGITVNTVAPGVVETDMGRWVDSAPGLRVAVTSSVALGGLGQPADVSDVVTFLASEQARWVTGVTIDVSGGQWLGPAAA